MSLIDKMLEKYVVLEKRRVDDGMGGFNVKWADGVEIDGAMVFNSSIQAMTAQAQGVTSVYTLTTKKNVTLDFHDVLRRKSDNKVFRVTSDGDDKYTPNGAGLNMRQVTCEEWTLPPEEEDDQGTGTT